MANEGLGTSEICLGSESRGPTVELRENGLNVLITIWYCIA